jgi:predicted phosphodiesterase
MRWLHISDIHERERDRYFRQRTYDRIIEEVGKRQAPDVVFLTGDMAFSGRESEYRSLEAAFVEPLRAALPAECPVFTIPGNHDVDRNRGSNPRTWFNDVSDARLFQGLDGAGAQLRKEKLFPRFEAYAAFEHRVSVWGGANWLTSERGSVCWTKDIDGAKIAIVGVNTAWLCHGDDDAGRLTPGRYMLEAALDDASKAAPDLLIVLGHHPLDALIAGSDDSDGKRVRTLLKRHNALYLHGDLHAGDSERFGDDTNNTLAIQAPAAFQAVDDKRWRNGLMWGEADVRGGWIMLEPQVWNDAHSEFKLDGDAGHNKFRLKLGDREVFRLRLPGRMPKDVTPSNDVVPPGWISIDREGLEQIKEQRPSADIMADFFDGEFPSWQLATAPGVRPRKIAEQLARKLQAARSAASRPRVLLVLSAGSEGKSTALIHAAAELVGDQRQRWTCLYRQVTAQPWRDNWLAQLPNLPDHAWVVVIDDADNVAPEILQEVNRIAGRGDIHLLLAARDAEWQIRKIGRGAWDKSCNFSEERLSGLDEVDAERIVSAWSFWGGRALGQTGVDKETAVASLLQHARDAAARNEAGELLGALLLTRDGQHLKARVAQIIEGLGDQPLFGRRRRSLRDIYAMIAAMHAENQLYLSRFVLAHAIGGKPEDLDRALNILRRETRLIDAGQTYILTRHRVIAEAVCDILSDDPAFNLKAAYPLLARSARELFRINSQLVQDEIAQWNYDLAARFLEKGQLWWPVAEAVAKALHEADPRNPYLLTACAKVLRDVNKLPEAMALLKTRADKVDHDRVFFYDWSTVAGMSGNHGLGVWLAGRSLADGIKGEVDSQRCELSLAGLGIAFGQLYRTSPDKRFAKAEAACGQLGLLLPRIKQRSRDALELAASNGRRHGIPSLSASEARKAIHDGVIIGSEEVEPVESRSFESLIGDPAGYKYSAMLNQIDRQSKAK